MARSRNSTPGNREIRVKFEIMEYHWEIQVVWNDMNERTRNAGGSIRWSVLSVILALSACGGNDEVITGIENGRLAPCPDTPNCVSSDATDDKHRVEPYRLKAAPTEAWHGLENLIAAEKRTQLVSVDDTYMHVEFVSAVMRFVDDTEFHLRPGDGIIAVRSASRSGSYDMGVNRKRIEQIREALRARNLVE